MAYRVEVFQANMINKFLLNANHPLQEYLSAELVSPQPQNTRHKKKWLSTICRANRKLSPSIPATDIVPRLQPWSRLPLQIITNDHLPSKQSTDPMILYDLTTVEMANIIQPRDNIFFTDGSVAGGRSSAAFTHCGHPYLLRLSNNASIMQAEDVASRMPTPPILTWIPSHLGIEGNEAADRAARQALLKPAIDTYLPLSKARTRQTIKQTAWDIYETLEQLNPSRSVSLHQHVSLSDQRAIYRLRLFVRPYNQIKHTDQAVCPYCDEHFEIYTVHYICMCPASQVHRSKLLVDVPSHMYNIDYTPLTLEILRRQGARRHKELIQLIHRFPPAS